MAYSTFEAFKRNLFSKTKKERETSQKINKLEKQIKRNKNIFTYGKKKFKTRETAQAYLDKIKSNRDVKAFIKYNNVLAKHELQRLDKAIKSKRKLNPFESTLKMKFPDGILGKKNFYKKDLKIDYRDLLEQLYTNFYGDIGGVIISIGQISNNETLKNQGSIVYTLSKMGALHGDDYEAIYNLVYSVSSKDRVSEPFVARLVNFLDNILKKYVGN